MHGAIDIKDLKALKRVASNARDRPSPYGSSAFLLRVVITMRATLPRFFRSVRTWMSIAKRATPRTRSVRTLMEER